MGKDASGANLSGRAERVSEGGDPDYEPDYSSAVENALAEHGNTDNCVKLPIRERAVSPPWTMVLDGIKRLFNPDERTTDNDDTEPSDRMELFASSPTTSDDEAATDLCVRIDDLIRSDGVVEDYA
jgi:hypothetical protein